MKTKAYIVLNAVGIFLLGCSFSLFAQTPAPNVHVTVHKQTDANGNVISYDSTYTYIYSGKCCHSDAYVDSIMKKYGMSMNSFMYTLPSAGTDIYNFPLFQQFGVMDFDKMQQMMQNQMNEIMQMYGTPPCNGFFCQPAPTPQCCPKDTTHYQQQRLEKKCPSKQNKPKGGVQI